MPHRAGGSPSTVELAGIPDDARESDDAWLTVRWMTLAELGLGPGRLRGGSAPGGRRGAGPDRHTGFDVDGSIDAVVDDDGTARPSAPRRDRRRWPCGAPRPTTTGSAGWPRRGQPSASTASSAGSCRSSEATATARIVDEVTTGAGHVVRHERTVRRSGGRLQRRGDGHRPVGAHRPAPGRDRARDRARPRGRHVVRDRPARDLPGPEARRPRRRPPIHGHGADRAVHPAAGERRPRGRALAGPDRCRDRRGPPTRLPPAGAGLGDPSPRGRPRRRDPSRRSSSRDRRRSSISTPPTAAWGRPSCGPDTLPQYLVGPGTYPWSWSLQPSVGGEDVRP